MPKPPESEARPMSLGELFDVCEKWATAPDIDFEDYPSGMLSTPDGLHGITLAYSGPTAQQEAIMAMRFAAAEYKANAAVWISENWATNLETRAEIHKWTRGTGNYGHLPESMRRTELFIYGCDNMGFEKARSWIVHGTRPNREYELVERGMEAAIELGVRPLILVGTVRPRP